MKRRIHDLMFCSGVEDRLVAETRPDEARPERFRTDNLAADYRATDMSFDEEPHAREMRLAIMRNLHEANATNATFAPVGFEQKQDELRAAHSNLDPSHEKSNSPTAQQYINTPLGNRDMQHVASNLNDANAFGRSAGLMPINQLDLQAQRSGQMNLQQRKMDITPDRQPLTDDGVRVLPLSKSRPDGDGGPLSKIVEQGQD